MSRALFLSCITMGMCLGMALSHFAVPTARRRSNSNEGQQGAVSLSLPSAASSQPEQAQGTVADNNLRHLNSQKFTENSAQSLAQSSHWSASSLRDSNSQSKQFEQQRENQYNNKFGGNIKQHSAQSSSAQADLAQSHSAKLHLAQAHSAQPRAEAKLIQTAATGDVKEVNKKQHFGHKMHKTVNKLLQPVSNKIRQQHSSNAVHHMTQESANQKNQVQKLSAIGDAMHVSKHVSKHVSRQVSKHVSEHGKQGQVSSVAAGAEASQLITAATQHVQNAQQNVAEQQLQNSIATNTDEINVDASTLSKSLASSSSGSTSSGSTSSGSTSSILTSTSTDEVVTNDVENDVAKTAVVSSAVSSPRLTPSATHISSSMLTSKKVNVEKTSNVGNVNNGIAVGEPNPQGPLSSFSSDDVNVVTSTQPCYDQLSVCPLLVQYCPFDTTLFDDNANSSASSEATVASTTEITTSTIEEQAGSTTSNGPIEFQDQIGTANKNPARLNAVVHRRKRQVSEDEALTTVTTTEKVQEFETKDGVSDQKLKTESNGDEKQVEATVEKKEQSENKAVKESVETNIVKTEASQSELRKIDDASPVVHTAEHWYEKLITLRNKDTNNDAKKKLPCHKKKVKNNCHQHKHKSHVGCGCGCKTKDCCGCKRATTAVAYLTEVVTDMCRQTCGLCKAQPKLNPKKVLQS